MHTARHMDKQTNSNFERHSAGMRTHLKSGFSKTINRRLNTMRHASGRANTFSTVQHPLYKQRWTNGVGTNNRTAHGLKRQITCKRDRNCGALPFQYSNICATIISTQLYAYVKVSPSCTFTTQTYDHIFHLYEVFWLKLSMHTKMT